MLGEIGSTTGIFFFVFSVASLGISIATLLYLRHAVKKEHQHINKVIATIWKLKDHLQKQNGEVEKRIEDHIKGQKEWETSLKKWLSDELMKQHQANEAAVIKIGEASEATIARIGAAVDTIGKSREALAKNFGEFVGLLRVAMRAEKALLETAKVSPDRAAGPSGPV